MFEILFLGTGASAPSRDRGLPSAAVRKGRDIVLLDCGEGTQRQIMISPFSFMKVKAILITHLHGDHVLGIPGLILTMGLSGRKEKLLVVGPEGTASLLENILSVCGDELTFELLILEAKGGEKYDLGDMYAEAFPTEHGVPSIGFAVSEKDTPKVDASKAEAAGLSHEEIGHVLSGKTVRGITADEICAGYSEGLRIVYSGDTSPCESLKKAAKNADVLIHEATFASDQEKAALLHNHTTASQAASVAKECGVGALILTHISNRYKDRTPVLEEAAAVFPKTYVAADFSCFRVTKSDFRLISEDRPE